MAIDCTVTGPPLVAITSPLGAGGSTTSVSDFYREFYDCTPAGVCVKFYRWYSGTTRLAIADLTAGGSAYVILGTVSDSCSEQILSDLVHECLAGVCKDLTRLTKTNCLGAVSVSYLDNNNLVYVPTGTVADGCCTAFVSDYHDVSVGQCITVRRSVDSCGTIVYNRLDGSVWVPTGALAEGPCSDVLRDGTSLTLATVKAGSTPAVTSDSALVVAISPNNSIAPKRAGGSMFSGSLAAGVQTPIAANTTRTYIEVQNTHGTEYIRVNFAGVASATDGFHLAPGQSYSSPAHAVTTSAVSIFAFNAGATYAALEI